MIGGLCLFLFGMNVMGDGLECISDHCSNIAVSIIDAHDHNMNAHEAMRSIKKAILHFLQCWLITPEKISSPNNKKQRHGFSASVTLNSYMLLFPADSSASGGMEISSVFSRSGNLGATLLNTSATSEMVRYAEGSMVWTMFFIRAIWKRFTTK